MYSLEEAMKWIIENKNTTLADVKSLVNNTKAYTSNSKLTIFYSGSINKSGVWEYAIKLGEKYEGVTKINKIDVTKLLESYEFEELLTKTIKQEQRKNPGFNLSSEDIMNGRKLANGRRVADGLWDIASKNLARNAEGHVKTITGTTNSDSVFVQSELEELLKNGKVNFIDGMDIRYLRKLNEIKGFNAVVTEVKIASAMQFQKMTFGKYKGIDYMATKDFFEDVDIKGDELPKEQVYAIHHGLDKYAYSSEWQNFIHEIKDEYILSKGSFFHTEFANHHIILTNALYAIHNIKHAKTVDEVINCLKMLNSQGMRLNTEYLREILLSQSVKVGAKAALLYETGGKIYDMSCGDMSKVIGRSINKTLPDASHTDANILLKSQAFNCAVINSYLIPSRKHNKNAEYEFYMENLMMNIKY